MVPLYFTVDSRQEETEAEQEEKINSSRKCRQRFLAALPLAIPTDLDEWFLSNTHASCMTQHTQGSLHSQHKQQGKVQVDLRHLAGKILTS